MFSGDHMAYDYDRREERLPQPSLEEMAAAAVGHLSALAAAGGGEAGYYLMVEVRGPGIGSGLPRPVMCVAVLTWARILDHAGRPC